MPHPVFVSYTGTCCLDYVVVGRGRGQNIHFPYTSAATAIENVYYTSPSPDHVNCEVRWFQIDKPSETK